MEKTYFGFVKESQFWFKVYFFITCLGGIMDFFNFIVIFNHFGEKGNEYSEIVLILLVLCYLGMNLYWIGYGVILRKRFPNYISEYMTQVIFSAGKKIEEKLEVWNTIAENGLQRASSHVVNKFDSRANSQ